MEKWAKHMTRCLGDEMWTSAETRVQVHVLVTADQRIQRREVHCHPTNAEACLYFQMGKGIFDCRWHKERHCPHTARKGKTCRLSVSEDQSVTVSMQANTYSPYCIRQLSKCFACNCLLNPNAKLMNKSYYQSHYIFVTFINVLRVWDGLRVLWHMSV